MTALDIQRLDGLAPELRRAVDDMISALEALHCPVAVIETLRSFERQEELFAAGRTKPGPIVTFARPGQTWHHYGRAIDLAWRHGDTVSYKGPWLLMGTIGEHVGLTWGGRFRMKDLGHFELPDRRGFQVCMQERGWLPSK